MASVKSLATSCEIPAIAANPDATPLTDDPEEILRFACEALDAGIGCALVTIVEIRGGAARSLGAQMSVRSDGTFRGFVSGGCVEASVAAEAVPAIEKGIDRYLLLGEGSKFFDIVLPCGGGITLAIHVLRQGEPLREILNRLKARQRTALRYDPSRQRLSLVDDAESAELLEGCFVRNYRPRPRIVIAGQSIEAEATASLGIAAGYDVVRIAGSLTADIIDRDTAIALLHHDLDREIPTLARALAGEPFYIGALGSGTTHARRCEMLRAAGTSEADIGRIKAPIGIFAKARDANSLALSVLADIAAAHGSSR